ncbi:MAG: hypothetical protein GXP55_17175 [Deltaproteobacteria bacterium]|nr:hypothetical protein [Deltaproteobacteria bacterium]
MIALAAGLCLTLGCNRGFAGQSTLERQDRTPGACFERCQEAGMRMTGYVFLNSEATACVCAMNPDQTASRRDDDQQLALTAAAAAARLVQQEQEAIAQQQQQQRQATARH